MCTGTPQPGNSFLLHIPEFHGEPIGREWSKAIHEADIAIHQPATQARLKLSLQYAASGMNVRAAALKANVTEQFLTTSPEYRVWSKARWATAFNQ